MLMLNSKITLPAAVDREQLMGLRASRIDQSIECPSRVPERAGVFRQLPAAG